MTMEMWALAAEPERRLVFLLAVLQVFSQAGKPDPALSVLGWSEP